MSEIPNDPAPGPMSQAIEANISGYFRCLGAVSGADPRDDASMLVVATGTPKSDYNVVLRCRFAQADADHEIERIMAVFRTRRLNMVWYTNAFTRPVDLGARLERSRIGPWTGHSRDGG